MRFLIMVLLGFLVISVVLTIFRAAFSASTDQQRRSSPGGSRSGGSSERLVKDPVCGTYVPASTAIRAENMFFCSEECRAKYLKQA